MHRQRLITLQCTSLIGFFHHWEIKIKVPNFVFCCHRIFQMFRYLSLRCIRWGYYSTHRKRRGYIFHKQLGLVQIYIAVHCTVCKGRCLQRASCVVYVYCAHFCFPSTCPKQRILRSRIILVHVVTLTTLQSNSCCYLFNVNVCDVYS